MIPIVGGGITCIREGILPYLPAPASSAAGTTLYYTSGFSCRLVHRVHIKCSCA